MHADEENIALEVRVGAEICRNRHAPLRVELDAAHVREPLPHVVAGNLSFSLATVLPIGLLAELGVGPKSDAAVLVRGEIPGASRKSRGGAPGG